MKMISIHARRRMAVALATLAATAIALTSCDSNPKSARGFRLPDGNAEKGKAAFVKLNCHACHTVQGADLATPSSKSPITVVLGGEVSRVRTYGELVTSVINPSHLISEKYKKEMEGKLSPMPEFNESMTVAQMIDVVAFLQPHYKKLQPDYVLIH